MAVGIIFEKLIFHAIIIIHMNKATEKKINVK